MSNTEFDIIQRYFSPVIGNPALNCLGVGDDSALLKIPHGHQLAVTTDSMVEGVHFFANTDPYGLGHKLLAVNLSDLAAMGAEPVSVTLALVISDVNEAWLNAFSDGFLTLSKQFTVDLIGGDTCQGPLTLTVQAMGMVPDDLAMRRNTAQPGDLIFVTGCLGDAGLGLKIIQGYQGVTSELALKRFHRPMPRVKEGLAIRSYASACIDLSDGLASDLQHILEQSAVGARLYLHQIPVSHAVASYIRQTKDWSFALTAGEDYELCFTVSPEKASQIDVECTQIGVIEQQSGIRIQRAGVIETLKVKGFEHFS